MRGKTEEEDVALEEDLLADEKEKAEHTMLPRPRVATTRRVSVLAP